MPELNVGETKPYFVTGLDTSLVKGAQNSGTSVSVTSGDGTIFTVTPDATPKNDPDGNPTVASGIVTAVAPGTALFKAALIRNSDSAELDARSGNVIVNAPPAVGPAATIELNFGPTA